MDILTTLTSLAIILFVILIAPLLSQKIKIPLIVIEMVFGMIIGKSFLKLIRIDAWMEVFAYFGLIYLLFLAGLEVKFDKLKKSSLPIILVASASLLPTFFLGYIIGNFFDVNPFFLGTILSTTSLGIVISASKELNIDERFKTILVGSTILVDITSIFLLVISIQLLLGSLTNLFFYTLVLVLTLFIVPFFFYKFDIGAKITNCCSKQPYFYFEVRFCFALIATLAFLTEFIGFHAILGAFIAGLIISAITYRGSDLKQNLLSFGYGFFVPFFFVMVGVNTDIPLLLTNARNALFLIMILLAGILGKVAGIMGSSKALKLSSKEGLAMGFIHTSRLSLILAGVEIGKNIGVLNEAAYSIFVLFALISVLVGPSIGKFLLK